MSYKPLILLTFFTLLFSLLYIRLKVPQGTGSIFEQTTLKNLHLQEKSRFVNPHLKAIAFSFFLSLQNFFRLVFSFRQAEQTKNGVKLLDLD